MNKINSPVKESIRCHSRWKSPASRGILDSLASTWLGINTNPDISEETEWDKFSDNAENYFIPVDAHSRLVWKIRVPELVTLDNGWKSMEENRRYTGQERHPVTRELVPSLQSASTWKYIHVSGEMGLQISVNYYGDVDAYLHIHDDSELDYREETEKILKLIEDPNLYEGQVCRVFDTYVEVIPSHALNLSPYSDEVEEAVRWLTSIIKPETRRRLSQVNLPLRAGLLLEGPPGSGKTTLTRRLAFELQGKVTTLYASSRVSAEEVISFASRFKCCLVVFEDVENFTGARGSDSFSEFLNAIDGVQDCSIMILATTNDSSNFDPAVRRPGRLERRVVIRSIHPDAGVKMLESRFPEASEELMSDLLAAVSERTGKDVAELPPAVIDSLARHLIMLEIPEEEYSNWALSTWEPEWTGDNYVE